MKSLVVDQEGKLTIQELSMPTYGEIPALSEMISVALQRYDTN